MAGMAWRPTINIYRLPEAADLPSPSYATAGSAGMDLPSCETVWLHPGGYYLVKTGLIIEIPHGYEGQVRPRSGLAAKHGITVLNAPGTIDSDYRGEIGVILINHGVTSYEIKRGDRIAQLVIAPVVRPRVELQGVFTVTPRGAGGFGSTGMRA